MEPEQTGQVADLPLCPHCKQPLDQIGWLQNPEIGLITFFHNVPECRIGLNCQFVQVEMRRIALPSELMPRGLG